MADRFAFCTDDPRVLLVPSEQLTPRGMSAEFSEFAQREAAWSADRVALFNDAFAIYWERSSGLARRCRDWPHPRLRNVAIVGAGDAIPLYAQMLNTSTWTLFASDFDPACSHAEFAAYLLAQGDRMAVTGEVTEAAVRNAAWWFEREESEMAAFRRAAAASPRPDAEAFRELAAEIDLLRRFAHATLRPPSLKSVYQAVPASDLFVPVAEREQARRLVRAWAATATSVVTRYRRKWSAGGRDAIADLCDWLRADAPPLIVCSRRKRILWQPQGADRLGAIRGALRDSGAEVVASIHADLEVVASRTRAFLSALVEPQALGPVDPAAEQCGYAYMHASEGCIAYDLHEPGIERLAWPALPYARPMLAARTVHEWCHRAVDAGWVRPAVAEDDVAARVAACAGVLERILAGAPCGVAREGSGVALMRRILARFADYGANVLARRFLTATEVETYARHNLRTLRGEYGPAEAYWALVRYVYEVQYLRLAAIDAPLGILRHSTWFEQDFIEARRVRLDDLVEFDARMAHLCACWAVDEARFRSGAPPAVAS